MSTEVTNYPTVSTETVSTETIAATLLTTPKTLQSLLSTVTPVDCRWRSTEEEWCINEVIGHLIAADQFAFAERIQLMLDEAHPAIPGVNVNQIAHERQDRQRSTQDLLDELALRRQEYALLLKSLTPSQLERRGHYGKYGDFLVSDFVYEWAYHDHDHLQQILGILKQLIWPNLSLSMQTALRS